VLVLREIKFLRRLFDQEDPSDFGKDASKSTRAKSKVK
jgi:hypothetical protein